MRLNKYLAQHTSLSRRSADTAILAGRIRVNDAAPEIGQDIQPTDIVTLDNQPIQTTEKLTVMLNKPKGYVCSRTGQGSATIYDLLPAGLHGLKSIGRLDKDSSGLILLTNDGDSAHRLSHPKFTKQKIYEVRLDRALQPLHHQMINDYGVTLEDGPSKLILEKIDEEGREWRAIMHEGRNRQIRRTFASLGYDVIDLHRTQFGEYTIGDMSTGSFRTV